MHEVGAFEAKNNLAALLDEVERGDEVLITRRGKPVARLVPAASGFDRQKARRAAQELLEARPSTRTWSRSTCRSQLRDQAVGQLVLVPQFKEYV